MDAVPRSARRSLLLLALLALLRPAGAAVEVEGDDPTLRLAGERIVAALADRGDVALDIRLHVGAVPPAADAAEGFAIARDGDRVTITGHDPVGALYGAQEVAECLRLYGAAGVEPMAAKPFLAVRQYKYNIPSVGDQAWFHDEAYWTSLFDLLAWSRFNSIGFWHLHPFPYLIRYEQFPDAAVLTAEQTERNIATWRMIFRLAKERGIETYLYNWNIHVPSGFAEKHGVEQHGEDSPAVRAYMRYCVAETLRTYPDLTGLGLTAGENMPSHDYDWREEWIKETFLAGIADSGRVVPLLHRYWFASPDSIRRIIADDYPGPLLVPLKFNGEQMYTDTRPHFLDPQWIDYPDYRLHLDGRHTDVAGIVDHLEWIPEGPPYSYKVVWHLRNDTIMTYRWADPAFVRETVRNCGQDWSAGYLMGQERTQTGPDVQLAEPLRDNVPWRYGHERLWLRFMLWGRLGYDPDTPDRRWAGLLGRRHGGAGEDLLAAYAAASRIIPTISRFHFNYMNGDWQPEWCTGAWNTGFGRGQNLRHGDGFHDAVEFVFNHTIDPTLLDIPEYVGLKLRGEAPPADALTPPQIADELSAAADAARAALDRVPPGDAELDHTRAELTAQAALGDYYAAKIRGATSLMEVFAGDESARADAVAQFERAAEHWDALDRLASPLYSRAATAYDENRGAVQRDIRLAQHAASAPEALAESGVLKRASERPRFDFDTLEALARERLAPALTPLFGFDEIDLSSADVLLLGRQADAFNALPLASKQRLLERVAEGATLVVLRQDFPPFAMDWLPGGLRGTEDDSDTFAWTDADHPLTQGVDPAPLRGTAMMNDPLAGWDETWLNLTDPPGGLLVRPHGDGWIVWAQLELYPHRDRAEARRLLANLLGFGQRERPRVVLLEGASDTLRLLDAARVKYEWVDALPRR